MAKRKTINENRLLANLRALREFTDTPGEGVTRFSYGTQDAKAREYILTRARRAGCTIEIDALQNIRIGLATNRPDQKLVLAGSHIDTVRNGGWLDGIYGVCGALEVLETLAETGAASGDTEASGSAKIPSCGYQLVIFAEEEGSNFGSTMTGSKFVTGMYKEPDLDRLKDDEGRTLAQRLTDLRDPVYRQIDEESLHRETRQIPWDFSQIKAMLELHIEQGPVLEQEALSLGIVDAIFGMRVIQVTLTGVGNHAGATPMTQRYDALCTAAECILTAEKIVKADPDHRTVVTAGKLELQPNCSNVIPETVTFTIEVRDKFQKKIDRFMEEIICEIRKIAKQRQVACQVSEHSHSSPLQLNQQLIQSMDARARSQAIPHQIMDSGAVHDACMIAQYADTGMIFVPSIGGRSHVPEENTGKQDLITGVQFLLDTVWDLLQ